MGLTLTEVPRATGGAEVPRATGGAEVPRATGGAEVPRATGGAEVNLLVRIMSSVAIFMCIFSFSTKLDTHQYTDPSTGTCV